MIAVFYDVENLRENINYKKAILKVSELCKDTQCIQFAYAEWSRFNDYDRNLFIEKGINLKQVINGIGYSSNIKNVADIALTVDVIELLFKNENIKHFIIVSGDGGYISLINKVKEYGKTVSIISLEDRLSHSLSNYVDDVYIIDDKEQIEEKSDTKSHQIEAYKKAMWAICKSYDDYSDISQKLYRNFHISEKLKQEGIFLPYLIMTYAKAIDKALNSKEVKDYLNFFKIYVSRHPHLEIVNNIIHYTASKVKMTAAQEKKIRKNTALEKKTVIEFFRDANIELSSSNISVILIEEVINNTRMYLSLPKSDFINLLKENTKRSIKLITGIVNMFYLLNDNEIIGISENNYKDILSARLSVYLSTKVRHQISKNQIKMFFDWE